MAITITTLNNNAAVAKTWAEIAKDRVNAEWLNTSDSTPTKDVRIYVKQSIVGKTKTGIQTRRSLVSVAIAAPTTVVLNGNSTSVEEKVVMNFTVTCPAALATLTATDRYDMLAYAKNLLTTSVLDALVRGEV